MTTFKTKKKNSDYKNLKNNLFYYSLIMLLLVEWFLNHPSLRYGGYVIFSLIFFIPLCNFLPRYEISKNFSTKVFVILSLVILIFVSRNIDRIIYEINFYKATFNQNMFFFTDKKHFRIDNKLNELSQVYHNCNQSIDKCSNNEEFIVKKSYGKMILIRIRN